MIRRHHHNPRRAFTLIELMVAMALTMFVMVILTQAFTTSMDTFRQLKGIGDMERNMRTAITLLRNDLQADHFEGKRRLSDPGFWSNPVREGFFRIAQGSGSTIEGNDSDGISSLHATNHRLHFTVKRRGNKREHFMSASVPNSSPLVTQRTFPFPDFQADSRYGDPNGRFYTSQWAEVAYFLRKSGTTTDPLDPNNSSGTPLFSLYRSQKLLVPDPSVVNTAPNQVPSSAINSYSGISCVTAASGSELRFNSPTDVTVVNQRAITDAFIRTGTPEPLGASLVMTNVVSFNVQGVARTGGNFDVFLAAPNAGDPADTSNRDTANPLRFADGVQIILRVWDQKTEQARQVTVIQDL